MPYTYQTDDMDALRQAFEDMLLEIESLKDSLDDADEAIVELYHEANDLERELNLLRELHDQYKFDAEEDYLELERDYNRLAEEFSELYDMVNPTPDFDDDNWDLFEITGISFK